MTKDDRLRTRLLNVACRTIHIVAFAVLFGGHVWGVEPDRLGIALWVTVTSGVALMAVEVVADRRWMLEVRGAVVLLKLGLLLAVPIAWEHRVAVLTAVAVVAAAGSHLPGRFRHASWIRARRAPQSSTPGASVRRQFETRRGIESPRNWAPRPGRRDPCVRSR